jgi:serine/threonine protein kinase/tetratricopeptide (TPR) repeat protein
MPADPKRVRDLFLAAAELPAADRAAYLSANDGGDAELRAAVERLLAAHEQPAPVLLRPAPGVPTADYAPIAETVGTRIGPYKLMEQIGEGGFGLVFVAEQTEPVRRKVAVKVIKPGMDSSQVIARFQAERQALALMDHPNIARVLDAGATDSGRPYFVMELVRGIPITAYCDQNQLPPHERLELFVSVCHAIQHAHQKGVIHRDIKPSNVLVTSHDGKPVAKVIDFGVSKAIHQPLTDRTIYTNFAQMIGTPLYMSPEQAEMSGLDIDTRSDIYSLGVLLYELLTGSTPLAKKRVAAAAYDEIRRLIREEEPPKPSTRLSSSDSLASIAAQRHTEPAKLSKLVRGDLDWITMKALEKDRTRRYETANGLAREIQRYLADEVVEARPPSARYRLHKFLRKHRAGALTAAAFVALLLAGVALSTWQAVRAMRAEAEAVAERDEKEQARKDADEARHRAEDAAERLRQATVLAGRGQLLTQQGRWYAAHAAFAIAEELEPGLNSIYVFRRWMYEDLGLWDLAADDDLKVVANAGTAWGSRSWYQHALLRRHVGDEEGYQRACRWMLQWFGDGTDKNATLDTVRACVLAPEPVIDPAELVLRAQHADLAWHVYLQGLAHYRAGQYEQAVERLNEAFASNWPVRSITYPPLAMAYHRLGKADEAHQALAAAKKAIDGWTEEMLKDPGRMPIPWFDWLECQHLYREAKIVLTGSPPAQDPRIKTIRERALAAISHGGEVELLEHARAHAEQGAWTKAAAAYAKALEVLLEELAFESKVTPICLEIIQKPEVFAELVRLRPHDARLWVAHGRLLASRREWEKAAADYRKVMESRPPDWSASLEYACVQLLAGDRAGYQQYCARLVKRFGDTNDPGIARMLSRVCTLAPGSGPDVLRLVEWASRHKAGEREDWHALGAAHYRAGHFKEAIRCFREQKKAHPDWPGQCMNNSFLALANYRLGQTDEARQWLDKSDQWLEQANRQLALEQGGFPAKLSRASIYPADWLTVQVLRREAETLKAGRP